MSVLFYSSYVMGTMLWIETGKWNADSLGRGNCATMGLCQFTLLRLTFFDGNG